MTLQDWGSIGELLGAVATIATLIYLATQIRNNTSQNRQQALENAVDRIVLWGSRVNRDPELLRVYIDGGQQYLSWDHYQRMRFHFIMIEILAAYETILEHAKTGSIKTEAVKAIEGGVLHELGSPGGHAWWQDIGRTRFAPDFVQWVDLVLEGVEDPAWHEGADAKLQASTQ